MFDTPCGPTYYRPQLEFAGRGETARGRGRDMKERHAQESLAGVLSLVTLLVICVSSMGCQSEPDQMEGTIAAYRDRMLTEHREAAQARQASATYSEPTAFPAGQEEEGSGRHALLTTPNVADLPDPAAILFEIPDPADANEFFDQRLEQLRQQQSNRQDQRVVRNFERVIDFASGYIDKVRLPKQVHLSLAECIQRGLEHNYTIRYEAHNPAISQTRLVEAEAAFDVEFFLDSGYSASDQATASTFVANTSDTRSIQGGFRQLLPSGMQTSVSLSQQRSGNNLPAEYQSINPVYNSSFVAQFTQPLLRGFGLDVNRATIEVRKHEFTISQEQFVQKVRDTLLDIESAYWQLVSARRTVSILAETLAQNHVTYLNMKERLDHDATVVEVANAQSRWQSQEVEYLEAVKLVRDAEDQLKNLMNDPDLILSKSIEIIPTEAFFVAPLTLDHFGEVRTALENRSEVRQAREAIDLRRVSTNVAKNNILPKLDLSFQYEVQGIGTTGDNSFDNLTTNRFISYTVSASFAYNFGERAARAAWRRARLEESQAIVQLKQVTDSIVEEVNTTIRTLMVRYEQIPPQLESVQAARHNLRALQARTQRIDPNYLETELSGVQQLSNSRRTLLTVLRDYNLAIIQLEKAKGTLLEYNNVTVTDGDN